MLTKPKLMNPTPSDPSVAAEKTQSPHHFSLSVVTGFTLLGLLVTGIWDFGGFSANLQSFYNSAAYGGNYKLLTAVSILFEGKMQSLLGIVFGAGIVLLMQRKSYPVPIQGPDVLIRRQIWFIILGLLLAFILLWPEDLLYPFGIVGILLFAFWKLPSRSLLIVALACTLIYSGKLFWNYADDKSAYQKYLAVKKVEKKFADDSATRAKKYPFDKTKDSASQKPILAQKKLADSLAKKKDTLNSRQAGEKSIWEGLAKNLTYDSTKTVSQNKSMRAGYSKLWFYVKNKSQAKESGWLYRMGVWDIGSAMLLGMALWGMGFFSRRFSSSTYLITAMVLFALGVGLAWLRIHNNAPHLTDYAKYVESHLLPYNLFYPIEKLAMATAYASLAIGLINASFLQWFWKGFAAVGNMPVTNYVLQVFLGCFIFYGYGLGYYGRFEQWELYTFVAEICLVQVVFSVLWLRYYPMGPLEWVLKCLIYRKRFSNTFDRTVSTTN